LAEAQRRQLMRQAAQKQQGQQSSSVYQDVIRNMMARQPPQGLPPAPAGMTPPSNAPPQPGSTPPNNFAPPPPRQMAEGGSVDDDDGADDYLMDDGSEDAQPQPPASRPDYSAVLDAAEKKYKLPPGMAQAVQRVESGGVKGDPARAVSGEGAKGLMQIMPGTGKDYGLQSDQDLFDPQKSADTGAHYLSDMLRRYDGNVNLALAAYNTGPGTVDRKGITSAGQKYIKQVSYSPSAAPDADTAPLASNSFMGPLTPPAITDQATPTGLGTINQATPAGLGITDQATTAPPSQLPTRPIDNEIKRLEAQIGQQQDLLGKFPDRNSAENFQNSTRTLLTALGYPPDYMTTFAAKAQMKKATLQPFLQDAINRYAHPSPWSFLANIAAGMNHSGSALLPAMFAEGVGRATTQREADQEKALSDWDALNKQGETIDNNVDMLHERLGTAVGNMIERQSNADAQQQQRILAHIDKLQKDREDLLLKSQPLPSRVTGDTALIAISMGYDPNNLTPDQARAVLKVKKPAGENFEEYLNPPKDATQPLGAPAAPGVGAPLPSVQPSLAAPPAAPVAGPLNQPPLARNTGRNEDLLANLPPQEASTIRAMADYRLQLPTGRVLAQPLWQNRLQATLLYDPSFSQSDYNTRQKLQNGFTSGNEAKATNALNTVTQHLGQLEKNWTALDNSGGWGTPLNRPLNWLNQLKGDPRIARFTQDQQAVASELMRTWRQVGASEREIQDWKSGLDLNASPAAQQATIQEMYELIAGKLGALKNQYEAGMGRPANFHMLTPQTAERFTAHGVDYRDLDPGYALTPGGAVPPSAVAPPSAGAKRNFQGRDYVFDGTKWVGQ
jgi:hypothetical protein